MANSLAWLMIIAIALPFGFQSIDPVSCGKGDCTKVCHVEYGSCIVPCNHEETCVLHCKEEWDTCKSKCRV